jgi:hypothetical protein
MKKAELLKRIEALEARVRELEARPQLAPIPGTYYSPPQPYTAPAVPGWPYPTIICGDKTARTYTGGEAACWISAGGTC